MTLWAYHHQPEDSSTSQPDDSGNTITIGSSMMQAASPEFMLHQLIGSYGFHGDTIDGIIESMTTRTVE